jgi:phosphoglycolate phosphatase
MQRVIIFDFDGVIVDSADIHLDNFNKARAKFGFKKPKSKHEYLLMCERNFYDAVLESGMDDSIYAEIQKYWNSLTLNSISRIPMFKGIKELLMKVKDSNILYLVTSNYYDIVISYINNNNIAVFKEVIAADQEKSKIKKIEHIKNKHPGKEIILIGDTKGDIFEGKKAGVATVAATWGYHNKQKLLEEKPDHIFDSIEELREFLLRTN